MTTRVPGQMRKLPPLPKMGTKSQRPLRVSKPAARPRGPRLYRPTTKLPNVGGPGTPPDTFVTQWQSGTEWVVYWALAKVTGSPANPRQGPFLGGATWSYQAALQGGRQEDLGNVADFLATGDHGAVAIRIQTTRYHIITDPAKIAKDLYLKTRMMGVTRVIDVYEQEFIGDPSGVAAIVAMRDALRGIQHPNPLVFGTAANVRSAMPRVSPS